MVCGYLKELKGTTQYCFLASVEDRNADTLIPIIKKHVLPRTTIISDCWKAYSRLEEENYQHQTVKQRICQ